MALDSGDFALMDRKVVQAMNALPERLRFPRGLRSWVGFRQIAVPYERAARKAGRTKYSITRLYNLATDGIASSSVSCFKDNSVFFIYICVHCFDYRGSSRQALYGHTHPYGFGRVSIFAGLFSYDRGGFCGDVYSLYSKRLSWAHVSGG